MTDESGAPGQTLIRDRALGVLIIGALLFLVGLVILAWRTLQPKPELAPAPLRVAEVSAADNVYDDYTGEKACAVCHPGEAALQSRSGHSRTLWRAVSRSPERWLPGKPFPDPEQPEIEWSYRLQQGVLFADRSQNGRTDSLPLELGVGSGKHGVTFVTTRPGLESDAGRGPSGIEHRISYNTAARSMAITPGQTAREQSLFGPTIVPAGRLLSPEQLKTCLSCHCTLTSGAGFTRLDLATMVPNVTCERCHGPGGEHVSAARGGETDLQIQAGLDDQEPARQIRLCGECHRTVRDVSGSKLNPDNTEIIRYQPVGLSLSACYARATSGLKCTSCHDPHGPTSTDHASYNAVCLSCHQGSGRRTCPRSPRGNCIGCHMPRRKLPDGSLFTDHWIRTRAQADSDTAFFLLHRTQSSRYAVHIIPSPSGKSCPARADGGGSHSLDDCPHPAVPATFSLRRRCSGSTHSPTQAKTALRHFSLALRTTIKDCGRNHTFSQWEKVPRQGRMRGGLAFA
jgi:predicted CXXCH cytochrome family protein